MSQATTGSPANARLSGQSQRSSRSSSGMRSPSTSQLLKQKVELYSRILYLKRQREMRQEKKSMQQYAKQREELAVRNNQERIQTIEQLRAARKEQEDNRKQTVGQLHQLLEEKPKQSKAQMIEERMSETQQTKQSQQELLAYGQSVKMTDSMKRKQLHDGQKQFEAELKDSKDQKVQDRLERTKQAQAEYRKMDEKAKETAQRQLEELREQEQQLLKELEQEQ